MSRRARALAFGGVALLCAGLAAAAAGGYRADVADQLGPLRPVLVARTDLPAREPLRPRPTERSLEVRRVPVRFAPPDALAAPEQALGRAPAIRLSGGSYVTASALRVPRARDDRGSGRIDPGRRPVEIAVSGAQALAAGAPDPHGLRVDVVVTTEPGPGGGAGRTYLAAEGVELLGLTQGAGEAGADELMPGLPDSWIATLALTREQALRLIQAESFARGIRLISSEGGGG